jgi:hypothetical protein
MRTRGEVVIARGARIEKGKWIMNKAERAVSKTRHSPFSIIHSREARLDCFTDGKLPQVRNDGKCRRLAMTTSSQ